MKAIKKAIANTKKTVATKIRNVAIWLFKDELKNIVLSDGVLDYENLALFIDERYIAEHIRDEDVAKHVEVDPDDVAYAMNIDDVASHIDMDSVAYDMQSMVKQDLSESLDEMLEDLLKNASFKMSI